MDRFFNKRFCLDVGGYFACFTRPEMKVERVSYDVITPSAARGIFQAVFWKPAIRWIIKEIEVLNEIRFISIRRNELNNVMTSFNGIYADDSKNRAQRAGLLLRDVRYRLHAELEFIRPNKRPGVKRAVPEWLIDNEEKEEYRKEENPGKYYGIFERRAKKGQCFTYPYLGCREFSCSFFRLVEDVEQAKAEIPAIKESRDLGFMLYDLDFEGDETEPAFFRAKLIDGVISVPDWDSEEVRR